MPTVAELRERRARLAAQWEALNDAADERSVDPRKGYTIDTGDGRLSGFFNSLDDIYDAIYLLERRIDYIDRRLRGAGVQVTRLSRYCGGYA